MVIDNATEQPARSTQHPDPNHLTFLIASRWNTWKGHETLLRAWRAAGQPGRLLVAGGPPPVGEAIDVRSLVKSLGVERSVTLLGEVDDISNYVRRSHFVIVPSDDPEPFGLIAIEAFAVGRPVIATKQGGLGAIVTDGFDGFLFENRDAGRLTELLRSCTTSSSAAMSINAHATFRARYSVEAFNSSLQNFWVEQMGPAQRAPLSTTTTQR